MGRCIKQRRRGQNKSRDGQGAMIQSRDRRLNWWRERAIENGINTDLAGWKSAVARAMHPLGRFVCSQCGRWLDMDWIYPASRLRNRVRAEMGDGFEIRPLETVYELLGRIAGETDPAELLDRLSRLLTYGTYPHPPDDLENSLDSWLEWVEEFLVPSHPTAFLSPGSKPNNPDRFDGFHNIRFCCRDPATDLGGSTPGGTPESDIADTGRVRANMAAYGSDRRAYQSLCGGDWHVADRLMRAARRAFSQNDCPNLGEDACSNSSLQADHVGPISLGFTHRPEFRMICGGCNGSKGNRLSLEDVELLRLRAAKSVEILSLHALPVWHLLNERVVNTATAGTLSRIMRDNQRNAMRIYCMIADAGFFSYLAYRCQLHLRYRDPEFQGLSMNAESGLTEFDLSIGRDEGQQALREMGRKFRILREDLGAYDQRENRNDFQVDSEEIESATHELLVLLEQVTEPHAELNHRLGHLTRPELEVPIDEPLRAAISDFLVLDTASFHAVDEALYSIMDQIASELEQLWGTERYSRDE
jgi:Alw26I/Eco31I/Esp3I family type II restriction endonuclease